MAPIKALDQGVGLVGALVGLTFLGRLRRRKRTAGEDCLLVCRLCVAISRRVPLGVFIMGLTGACKAGACGYCFLVTIVEGWRG